MRLGVLALGFLVIAGCGPSLDEVGSLVDTRIAATLTAMPTLTPVHLPTPIPTATPVTFLPTSTPQPTPTPLVLPPTPTPQPTPTPIVLAPTPTPQPTATPLVLPPTPTPQPTPTPIVLAPTPTPQATATPQPVVDFNAVYARVGPSVFMIETPGGHGTGWLIEEGLILTAEHVVRGYAQVTVRQALEPAFSATVRATDSLRDIALLAFDTSQAGLDDRAAPLQLGDISTDDIARPLVAFGYSGSGVWPDGTVGEAAANVGAYSQTVDFGDDSYGLNLEMDAPVDPGDSGGPVLDSDGLVVGMVRAVQESTASGQRVVGTFFAVHVQEIKDALPRLKEGQSR